MTTPIEFFGESSCEILRKDINHIEMRDGVKVIGFQPMAAESRSYPGHKTPKVLSWAIHATLNQLITNGPVTCGTVRMESAPTFRRKADAQVWADAMANLVRE